MASLRASAARTELDKRCLDDALETMRTDALDPQRVLSSLVAMHGVLVAHPNCVVLVDAALSRASAVALLCDIMRVHALYEELQSWLCRVLTLASTNSLRFQSQANQLELWRDVSNVRSMHPGSLRVLQSTLALYVALLNGHARPLLTTGSMQSLIDEMLATVDRFALLDDGSSTALAAATSATKAATDTVQPAMVVAATRVLAAIYESPIHKQLLVETTTQQHAALALAIARRLVATFRIFLTNKQDVRLWLQLARLLIQQHGAAAASALLLPPASLCAWSPVTAASGTSTSTGPADAGMAVQERRSWHALLLDQWRDSAAVAYDLAALLMLVFARPYLAPLDALTCALLQGDDSLVVALCELLAALDSRLVTAATTTVAVDLQQQMRLDDEQLLLAPAAREIVRVLRQWSANATTRKGLTCLPQQTRTLLTKTLVCQLQRIATAVSSTEQQSCGTSSRDTEANALASAYELLLLLHELSGLDDVFASGVLALQLQLASALTALHLRLDASRSTASPSDANKCDNDVDALVRRASNSLEKALARMSDVQHRKSGSNSNNKRLPVLQCTTRAASTRALPQSLDKPVQRVAKQTGIRTSSSTQQQRLPLRSPLSSSRPTALVLRASAAMRL